MALLYDAVITITLLNLLIRRWFCILWLKSIEMHIKHFIHVRPIYNRIGATGHMWSSVITIRIVIYLQSMGLNKIGRTINDPQQFWQHNYDAGQYIYKLEEKVERKKECNLPTNTSDSFAVWRRQSGEKKKTEQESHIFCER